MVRTFQTHHIRKQQELTECYWEFEPCSGEYQGEKYQVMTPCCWESHPDFMNYRGEGIYRTKFYMGGNIRLEFKGVSHTATIYLDGQCIGTHYNAYSIFAFELTDLEEDWHMLEVKADNRFSEASALHVPNDYMSYGGISRPVVLEQIQDVFIEWVHVTPKIVDIEGVYEKSLNHIMEDEHARSWETDIEVCVKNISSEEKCIDTISQINGQKLEWLQQEIPANETIQLKGKLQFDQVKEWMPEQPELYYVESVLRKDGVVIDDDIDRFGFRQVTLEGKQIFINGKAIKIKGILNECASDSEYGKECYRKQFELIKELDTSRQHSFASCKFKTDISFGLPDVVAYNIYPLWYHDTAPDGYLDELYQWIQNETEGAGKPFLITEIGAGAIYGCRNAYHSKWTEEYQAEALEKQLQAVLQYEESFLMMR